MDTLPLNVSSSVWAGASRSTCLVLLLSCYGDVNERCVEGRLSSVQAPSLLVSRPRVDGWEQQASPTFLKALEFSCLVPGWESRSAVYRLHNVVEVFCPNKRFLFLILNGRKTKEVIIDFCKPRPRQQTGLSINREEEDVCKHKQRQTKLLIILILQNVPSVFSGFLLHLPWCSAVGEYMQAVIMRAHVCPQ